MRWVPGPVRASQGPRGFVPPLVLGLVLLASASCASQSGASRDHAPKAQTIYLIAHGWHTQVALPAKDVTGRLAVFRQAFRGARFLSFGWGERAFFMDAHPGIGEALRALLPAPSVLLVFGLTRAPRRAFPARVTVVDIHVSRPGLARLSRFIWRSVATRRDGEPMRLSAGPIADSAFYASVGTYDALRTCNTWTAEALHAANNSVDSFGVLFAGQVTRQVWALGNPSQHRAHRLTRYMR